jgi:predicted amidohydrolase YtcJ
MKSKRTSVVYYNCKAYTFDRSRKTARAIVVDDGRIVDIGGDYETRRNAPRGSDRYDLQGKIVVPGFIDCHTHFIQMGVDSGNIDLSKTKSLEEALALIREAAKRIPDDEWVIATNWKESGWIDGRFITREDLDSCCPGHPCVAHRVCGHMSTVNSKAISELCIDAKTHDACVDHSGSLTGVLKESAVAIARAATAPDLAKKTRGLFAATRMAHSLGVTSINDNGVSEDLGAYRDAERNGKLGIRVWFNTPSGNLDSMLKMSLSTGIGSDFLMLGGLKIFSDGALGARTAALSEDYCDDRGNRGILVHRKSDLDDLVGRANEADIQLVIHAIGDVGIGVTIQSLASAVARSPKKDHRHRIEHLELPTSKHLEQMRKHGLIASMQPNFIGEWGGTDGMYLSRLGAKRAARNNPFREVLASRVRLVFGSDCMPFSPLYGIHSAVNAPHPSQRISVYQAFAAYTRDAALASFSEGRKGTLTQGKFADFAVLSDDPFADPSKICSIRVLKTVVDGDVVYDRQRVRRGH